MSSLNPPTVKPRTTRKSTEIWLIGHPVESFKSTQLPSRKEVLALLMNYKDNLGLAIRDAIHATAEDLIDVWKCLGVPTRMKHHVVKKVKTDFEEWKKLKKNKENKSKRTKMLEKKEQRWVKSLAELFDIKAAKKNEEKSFGDDAKTPKRKYAS